MNEAFDVLEQAIHEVGKLRRVLKKGGNAQVRNHEERSLIKATALAWFNNHCVTITPLVQSDSLSAINEPYKKMLQLCDRATNRSVYDALLKNIIEGLSNLKVNIISTPVRSYAQTAETAPDFSTLSTDNKMRTILANRWQECLNCINGNAPLAATVMMGGLLETLLLARTNKEPNLSNICKSKNAPKDAKTGKNISIKEWTLRNYIDVAHELKWITQSAKNVGEVLRDYRNYIHPYKQFSHDINITDEDAKLFWEITKSISRQLLTK